MVWCGACGLDRLMNKANMHNMHRNDSQGSALGREWERWDHSALTRDATCLASVDASSLMRLAVCGGLYLLFQNGGTSTPASQASPSIEPMPCMPRLVGLRAWPVGEALGVTICSRRTIGRLL